MIFIKHSNELYHYGFSFLRGKRYDSNGQLIGHKYTSRIPLSGGGYRYIYGTPSITSNKTLFKSSAQNQEPTYKVEKRYDGSKLQKVAAAAGSGLVGLYSHVKNNSNMHVIEVDSNGNERKGVTPTVNREVDQKPPKELSDLKRIVGSHDKDTDQKMINPDYVDVVKVVDTNKDGTISDYDEYKKYLNISSAVEYIANDENCAYATAAYDMRQRGYDVCAADATKSTANTIDEISSWYENTSKRDWRTLPDNSINANTMSDIINSKAFIGINGGEARGQFCVFWSEGGGHSMAWERDTNGSITIRDCQTNTKYTADEWFTEYGNYVSSARVLRTDNRKPSKKMTKALKNYK